MEGKISKGTYISAIIYIILGIIMIVYPNATMVMFCYVLSIVTGVLGLINIISYFRRNVIESLYKYDFANGIMLLFISIILVVKSDKIVELIPVILGLLVFASGVIKLQHALDLKKIQFSGWLYVLIIAFLCLSIGAVCILQPAFIAETIVTILGISYLFCGITDVVTIILLAKKMKDYTKDKKEATEKEEAIEAMAQSEGSIEDSTEKEENPIEDKAEN